MKFSGTCARSRLTATTPRWSRTSPESFASKVPSSWEKGGTGYLRFESIRHGAELVVNGRSAGVRAFSPWVFKAVFRPGRNTLLLRISSSGGNEWRRCFREELEPAGWFNWYASRLNEYRIDDAECGVFRKSSSVVFVRNPFRAAQPSFRLLREEPGDAHGEGRAAGFPATATGSSARAFSRGAKGARRR